MIDHLAWHGPRAYLTRQLFQRPVQIMGHRGAGGLAPENTLAAFRVAADLNVPFELDVGLCKTGELVVMHDDTLDRTTSGTGLVSEATRQMLDALDVPTLNEVFNKIDGEVLINIEIKTTKSARRVAKAVVSLIRAHQLFQRVIVTSFDPFILQQVRLLEPSIVRGQIYGTFDGAGLVWYKKFLLKNLLLNRLSRPDLLMVEHTMVTQDYLELMHARGYLVFAWTPNEASEMTALITAGIDGVITDRPDIGLQQLGVFE
jgi:glycerophosphoryl diester phosphodiesterase